ncbi:hypothetical protein N5U17_09640 [Aliarcobacter butzleri]|uniref:hypothetical protein n=1 Tax=Aliarcobacter TaxID=2321111 RepID=UPI0021B3763D|nr:MULTISPECIES: hypothetical protein [Aliarcobacter]MCT7482645.1 hypothetical protein [Aliarcobacter cryaerophilus]MCT7604495.1 hypothetical protein [Aliarcobacter butzleri]
MKIDKSFMQNAINRINELQQEIINKSKSINGAEDFVNEKLKLYEEDEALRKKAKEIHLKEQKITESFFAK